MRVVLTGMSRSVTVTRLAVLHSNESVERSTEPLPTLTDALTPRQDSLSVAYVSVWFILQSDL